MTGFWRHAANLLSLGRALLVIPCVALLAAPGREARLIGLVVLAVALLLDGLDGVLARRLGTAGTLGSLLDTLADRITENVMFIFLAWAGLVPLAIPILFVTRSFIADAIRSIAYRRGIGTFGMNTSWAGRALVASRWSRVLYLAAKVAVFLLGGLVLVVGGGDRLRGLVWWGSVVAAVFCLVRLLILAYDSRALLMEESGRAEEPSPPHRGQR